MPSLFLPVSLPLVFSVDIVILLLTYSANIYRFMNR